MFDPLTIDERILALANQGRQEGAGDVCIGPDDRWPMGFSDDLEGMTPSDDIQYPLVIPADQIEEAIDDIDRQIESRDYRLIDQVEAVAAFRPNYRTHYSRGVFAELQYAAQTAGIPVHLIWDEAEDGPYADSPFGNVGPKHAGVEELIAALSS